MPSSGSGSQTAASATNCRNAGRMPGSPSSAPRRTPVIVPSGVRPMTLEPHRTQNVLPLPPSGNQPRRSPPPDTTRTEPGATRPVAPAAAPVRFWQRVQWQYKAVVSGSSTSKRTAPQPQPPVRGSSPGMAGTLHADPVAPVDGDEREEQHDAEDEHEERVPQHAAVAVLGHVDEVVGIPVGDRAPD